MKGDTTLGAKLSPRQSHAYKPLKRAVKVLGTKVVDRRTHQGRALVHWRAELIADLGGVENLSTQERALVDEAVMTRLIISNLNVWMLQQKSLVSGRNRGALPVVLHRNGLVATLKGLLEALGLQRRAKKVLSLEMIAAEYEAKKEAAEKAKVVKETEQKTEPEGERIKTKPASGDQ
jgi:hypothetical protein